MPNNNWLETYTALSEHPDRSRRIGFNSAVLVILFALTVLFTELLCRLGVEETGLVVVYYLFALIISSATPGYSYGSIAALMATLACDYFVLSPRFGFSFTRGSPVTLLSMLAATFLTSTLAIQIKNQNHLVREREYRSHLIQEITGQLRSARSVEAIIELTLNSLADHYGAPVVYYPVDPIDDGIMEACLPKGQVLHAAFLRPDERKRAHHIFLSRRQEVSGLSDEHKDTQYFAVPSEDDLVGVIGIHFQHRPVPTDLYYIQILSRQAAQALRLQKLSDAQSAMTIEAEKEKMRGTLLRSISHDLRTPLTSIKGASSAMLEQKNMPEETRDGLLQDIVDNAEWLIRMVENILTITKISEETMTVQRTPEVAEEVVAQAVSIVRRRFQDCLIHVRIPTEVILVPMDATLISQVLINLMENAAKNSRERELILVDVQKEGDFARFDVSDNGPGIPEHLLDHLFESYSPERDKSPDAYRGTGLGLSICRTIIHAHGGRIRGRNRSAGGAKFSFWLPLEQQPSSTEEDVHGPSAQNPAD